MRRQEAAAFSLVEVTVALGIAAFALVAILGVLPSGLQVERDSRLRIEGGMVLQMAADAIQAARESNGIYKAQPPFEALEWRDGGPLIKQTTYLSGEGVRVNTRQEAELCVQVTLEPPAALGEPGKTYIAVAWPAVAVEGAFAGNNFPDLKQAAGYVDTWLPILWRRNSL